MPKLQHQRGALRRIVLNHRPGGAVSIDHLAERIAGIEALLAMPEDPTSALDYSDEALATVSARVYASRRRRARQFDAAMFADPAWDMLLDLFIARARGKAVQTSSLCLAGAVPAATALRWIAVLEKNGLVERHAAVGDRRVKLVALSDKGHRLMRQYLIEGIEAGVMPTAGGFG